MADSPAPVCYRHPDRVAVEHCEVCRKPLCATCIWYAEEGHRLCPDHAIEWLTAGKAVLPPERYAESLHLSQASAAQAPPAPEVPYRGRSADLSAVLALVFGLSSLLACTGLYWVLPFLAAGLGLFAWFQSKQAYDPARTRWLGGVGLATGGSLVAAMVLGVLFFALCWLALVAGALLSGNTP